MNDTSPEVEAMLHKLFMQRSGSERVQMGFEMFSFSRAIVRSSLEAQGYRGVELQKQIFLRTYGQDFTPEQCEKICRALEERYQDQEPS